MQHSQCHRSQLSPVDQGNTAVTDRHSHPCHQSKQVVITMHMYTVSQKMCQL